MTITDKLIGNSFWLLLALVFPLFGTPYWRLNTGIMHIPLPVFILGAIFYLGCIYLLMHGSVQIKILKQYRYLACFCYLFLIWHFISLNLSEITTDLQIKEVVKLAVGLGSFFVFLGMFSKDKRILNLFILILIWSSALYYVYFLNNSISSGNVFLSANLDDPTERSSQNQFGWYGAATFPFAFSLFLFGKNKLFNLAPMLIIGFSIIYISSRGSWLAATFSVIAIIYFVARKSPLKASRIAIKVILASVVLILFAVFSLSKYIDIMPMKTRFMWLLNPIQTEQETLGHYQLQLRTLDARSGRVKAGLTKFSENPIFGTGPKTNPAHNDYVTILAETGLFGFIFFVSILSFIGLRCNKMPPVSKSEMDWISFGARGSFIAIIAASAIIDTYTSPHFWFFLALIMMTFHLETNDYTKIKYEYESI